MRNIKKKTLKNFVAKILNNMKTAGEIPPDPFPAIKKKQKLNNANLAKLQLLNAWVHHRAAELEIAPSLLAPQKLLEKMVTGDGIGALYGWREPLIGDDLQSLLEGRAYLVAAKNGLTLANLK